MEEKEAMPKQKRHFILFVLLIALGLMLGGEILGELLVLPLRNLLPEQYVGLKFLFLYLEFIGIDLLVLLYCSQAEKEILCSFRAQKRGGSRGNTAKMLALGLVIGFVMNGLCILIAWLHGDLDFSVGRFRPVYLLLALLCVLILSCFLLWLYRSGLIERTRHAAVALSDNIHEIDFDSEFAEALRKKDYAALVRLVYLSTLHTLDEQGRIVWRIHKTPMEYVAETGDASLMTMTHHFVKVRYGHFAATQGLYDEMSRLQSDIVIGGES